MWFVFCFVRLVLKYTKIVSLFLHPVSFQYIWKVKLSYVVCVCVRVLFVCVCVVGLFMGYLMCSVSAATKHPLILHCKWAGWTSQRWSCDTELGSVTLPSVSAIVHPWVRLFHWHKLSASWHHCACFSLQCHMLCCLCLETTAHVRLFYWSASGVVLSVSWTDLHTPTSLMCTFQN